MYVCAMLAYAFSAALLPLNLYGDSRHFLMKVWTRSNASRGGVHSSKTMSLRS